MINPGGLLPGAIMELASLRANEFAWAIGDIPKVIEAAKAAGLVTLGGQLQSRMPSGETYECYWIDIETTVDLFDGSNWGRAVEQSATECLTQFHTLLEKFDFVKEGKSAFPGLAHAISRSEVGVEDLIVFV